MKIADFDFYLPQDLIAQYPAKNRTGSRLLVLHKGSGEIEHRAFADLPEYLHANDLLVFNDTKVIPARIYGKKITGGKVEILIERILDDKSVLAHIRSGKRLVSGSCINITDKIQAKILRRIDDLFVLEFLTNDSILALLEEIGHIPLPPYIDRDDEPLDKERYQTVYAKNPGAIAAPTAGLHFDAELLAKIAKNGVNFAHLTLHVGAGTFQPVRVENIFEHKMHAEYIEVTEETCKKVVATKSGAGKVFAVGTTSVRSLETAALNGEIRPYIGDTDIFIYPGFKFNSVDALITNFHLPKSTLLMLVAALAGYENIMRAYKEAVEKKYRFFSYGDAMLIV